MALLDDWRAHSCQVFAAVAGGQYVVVRLELAREVIWCVEAAAEGDFLNGNVRCLQFYEGLGQAEAQQVFYGGQPHQLAE